MTKRERLAPLIVEMREQRGMKWREIGDALGISLKTAHDYYHDPDGAKARARKAKTNGVCCDCSTPTISDGSHASERCARCAAAHSREVTRAWIVASIREWAETFGAPPSAVDWNQNMARKIDCQPAIDRHASTARIWPSVSTVQDNYGTWNAAIEAAGFTPRKIGGRGASVWTRPAILALFGDLLAEGVPLTDHHLRKRGHGGAFEAAKREFGSVQAAIDSLDREEMAA